MTASSGRLGRVLLALISLGLSCGAGEVGLRLAGYEALYDVYSKPELFWQHDERLGWSLEPGARGRYRGPRPFPVEFDTAIEINSLGLRGPEPAPRTEGQLRVLVLGDSVVAGFEVEQAETFVARAEGLLRRRFERPVSVVNAGVRGYGTDQSLLWFRERGRALAPDLVVAVFSTNDFDDNLTLHRPLRPFGKGAFALRPSGALELVGVPVPRYELCSDWALDAAYQPARSDGPFARGVCRLQTQLADHSALFTLLATSLARLPGVVQSLDQAGTAAAAGAALTATLLPWPAPEVRRAGMPGAAEGAQTDPAPRARLEAELTTALLQALAHEVRASGAHFLLLVTPRNWQRLDTRALLADRIEPFAVTVSSAILPAQLRFRNDSHLNVQGHRVYAEQLAPLIERELRTLLRERARKPEAHSLRQAPTRSP